MTEAEFQRRMAAFGERIRAVEVEMQNSNKAYEELRALVYKVLMVAGFGAVATLVGIIFPHAK